MDGVKNSSLKHVLTQRIQITKLIAWLPMDAGGIILAGAVLKMDFLLQDLRLAEEEAGELEEAEIVTNMMVIRRYVQIKM